MQPSDSPVRTYGGEGKGPCPKESQEQISFFNKLRQEYPETWGRLAVHIRNEDALGTAQAMKRHKLEGLATGASDIQIPGCPSFVCEMKRTSPGLSALSEAQADYLRAAHSAGAFACVAFGAVAAYAAFSDWLALQPAKMEF